MPRDPDGDSFGSTTGIMGHETDLSCAVGRLIGGCLIREKILHKSSIEINPLFFRSSTSRYTWGTKIFVGREFPFLLGLI